MTNVDTVIDEIRESRKRMSEECGHDPARLVAYLKSLTPQYGKQIEAYRKSHPARPTVVKTEEQ